MKVIVRTRTELLHDSELTTGMHRLRGRVFKERLDWDVSVSDGLEVDQYDTFKPTYLLALEQRDVVGCVRLLPTTGRNMLADTFPVLLDGHAARGLPGSGRARASALTPRVWWQQQRMVCGKRRSCCLRP
jgi:acyl homoserine lactone synthase